jgi:uncharacterized membrane protein YcaP (DUF421 family)
MESMIRLVLGEGTDLTIWQMASRAVLIFVITLLLIRLSGRRSFGQHSPFDSCTTVLLGAILSRAVVGASPFWPTVGAATALVLMHRAAARASISWEWFETLVSGRERQLMQAGRRDATEMRKALVTERDLKEAVRKTLRSDDMSAVDQAVLERNGEITVIEKKPVR